MSELKEIKKEQLMFWENRIFPIYSRAPKGFKLWVDNILLSKIGKKASHIFSISDYGSVPNASRYYLGYKNPPLLVYEAFNESAQILTKNKLFVDYDPNISFLSIGVNIINDTVKFYITRREKNKPAYIEVYEYKNGNMIRKAKYTLTEKNKLIIKGNKRKAVGYDLYGTKAIHFLEKILKPSTKTLILSKKILSSNLFGLYMIEFKPEKNIDLFFR